ncbi:MAG TPA: ABC transporter ATP-binding protein [Thermomicrobiales bacterium]|nr:ABC transporter ATP-binding protein [Thermomicrobiales bacterium]
MEFVKVQLQTRIRDFLLAVDFSIENELVALLGRDNAGKTEILRSIAGVYTPEHGNIEILGRTVFNAALAINLPASERHAGWVPGINALFPNETVAENVRFPFRRGLPISQHEAERRIDETLDLLALSPHRNHLVRDLDERKQFWVALARTLVLDPEVLLIDQPFRDMDVGLQRRLRHDVQRIRRMIGVPALVATSDLEEAYEIGDRIALVDQGELLQFAPPRTLVTRPINRAVAELVRSVNVFPGTVLDSFEDGAAVQTDLGTLHVSGITHAPGEVEVVIRPEHIRILAEDEAAPADDNVLSGTLLDSTDYGALHSLTFHPDGAPSSRVLEISVSDPLFQQLELRKLGRRQVLLPSHAVHIMDVPTPAQPLEQRWLSEDAPLAEDQEPLG